MALDTRVAQNAIENVVRDAILYALGERLPSVGTVTELRAVPTMGASSTQRSDDDLIVIKNRGVNISYRWSSISTAADDGDATIKPNDVTLNGRWLKWTSTARLAPVIPDGDSYYLHELAWAGYLKKVLVLDRALDHPEIESLIQGVTPSVVIVATGDDPEDLTENVGHRWATSYQLDITVISQNLRDRREAAQGSLVPGEDPVGANALDGYIKAVLAGTNLFGELPGLRNVRVGRGFNDWSVDGMRRVYRERSYTVMVTEALPQAPNEIATAQQVEAKAFATALNDQPALDLNNIILSGLGVEDHTAGLTHDVAAGQAVIAGVTATYAGESAHVFNTNADTYRDLTPAGALVFQAVFAGAAPPSIASGNLRIGVTRTNGSDVVTDRFIAAQSVAYEDFFIQPLQ